MNRNKQLLANLVASVMVFAVQIVINFWLSPFVIARLGEEAYGFITLANNFTQYVTLITVAINSMASRFISLEYNKGNKDGATQYFSSVFWINVILSLFVFVISAIVILNLERLINIEPALIRDVKITFVISFANLILSFLTTCFTASTFATNRMDLHAFSQIGTNLIKLFLTVGLFVLLVPHIYYVSIGVLISSIFTFVVYLFLSRRLIPELSLSTKFFSIKKIIKLLKSGFWILISNISSLLLNGLDLLIANLTISQVAMGRLSVSKTLPTAVGTLLGFLSNIFAASLTSLVAEEKKEEIVKELRFTCKILGVFLTVPFAGIIIYGIEFLSLWLPNNVYNEMGILQVYILMMLTLLNVIVNAYMYSIHSLFIALDKVKVYSLMVLISSIISIFLTLLLATQTPLGVYAIAGTSTIVLSVVNLILVPRYAERILEIPPFSLLKTIFRNYLGLAVTCVLFALAKPLLTMDSWATFFMSAFVMAILGYILVSFVLFNKEERKRLVQVIKSKCKKN